MVFFNYSTMQMVAKIVYYGPGLCGKTTNLSFIYEKTSPKSRGEMLSLATETDRTLFFDLLPLDVGAIGGFKTKFQLYTVPGQVFYNATRKLVLKGVDGIVFVADSQVPMMEANQESFQNLKDNLRDLGLDFESIPLVFQYNKRDLPHIVPVADFNRMFDAERKPVVESSALEGWGVFETLKEISKLTLFRLKSKVLGDGLKKDRENVVEFKVQGSARLREEIVEETKKSVDESFDSLESTVAGTVAQTSEEKPRPAEESLPGLSDDVSFEDYESPEDKTPSSLDEEFEDPDLPSINFDTIELDELEEDIESEEMEVFLDESEDDEEPEPEPEAEAPAPKPQASPAVTAPAPKPAPAPSTTGANQPPRAVTPAAPPVSEAEGTTQRPAAPDRAAQAEAQQPPAEKAPVKKTKPKRDPLDSLSQITSQMRTGSSKSVSVDDLLSGVVSGVKKGKKKGKSQRFSVQVPASFDTAQMNGIFLDAKGNVVHSKLFKVDAVEVEPGKFEIKMIVELERK